MIKPTSFTLFSCVVLVVASVGFAPFLFNVIVDPYEMNNQVNLDLPKRKVSERAHVQLWKLAHYTQNPTQHVILGDSRARALRDKLFHEIGFTTMTNMAYGGGTMPEVFSTFWYLAEQTDLKSVTISVPLRMFDKKYKDNKDQVPEAIAMVENPFRYYTSAFVSRIGVRNLQASSHDTHRAWGDHAATMMNPWSVLVGKAQAHGTLTGGQPLQFCSRVCLGADDHDGDLTFGRGHTHDSLRPLTRPFEPLSRITPLPSLPKAPAPVQTAVDQRKDPRAKSLWQRQIKSAARNDWEDFVYAEDYVKELHKIAAYAAVNDIQLLLFIPPDAADMQQRLFDFGRQDIDLEHKHRMAEIAPVLDFNFASPLTLDPYNFNDAYHFNAKVAKKIVYEIVHRLEAPTEAKKLALKRRSTLRCPFTNTELKAHVSVGRTKVSSDQSCRVWHKIPT